MPTAYTPKPPTASTLKKRQQVEIGPWTLDPRNYLKRVVQGREATLVVAQDAEHASWEALRPGTGTIWAQGDADGKHALRAAMAAADAVLREAGYNVPSQ